MTDPMTILLNELAIAEQLLNDAKDFETTARNKVIDYLNAVNKLQKKIDSCIHGRRTQAPQGTDWRSNVMGSATNDP